MCFRPSARCHLVSILPISFMDHFITVNNYSYWGEKLFRFLVHEQYNFLIGGYSGSSSSLPTRPTWPPSWPSLGWRRPSRRWTIYQSSTRSSTRPWTTPTPWLTFNAVLISRKSSISMTFYISISNFLVSLFFLICFFYYVTWASRSENSSPKLAM